MLGVLITFLGEIGISQWSSPRLGKGKSMCLRWFRSLCWTDERHSRCNRKMERSSGRTQIVFVLPRCSWYRWRSNWLRVHQFPRIFIIVNSWKIQEDLETRRIQPEEFTDRIIFMPMFNDIVWNTNDENCASNAEKVKNYATRFFLSRTLDILGSRLGRKVVWKFKPRSKRAMDLHSRQKWNSNSKRLVILCSKVSVPWVVESKSRRMVKPPFTSTEIQQTQNSCSKQFIP